jgi:hypothetical protein
MLINWLRRNISTYVFCAFNDRTRAHALSPTSGFRTSSNSNYPAYSIYPRRPHWITWTNNTGDILRSGQLVTPYRILTTPASRNMCFDHCYEVVAIPVTHTEISTGIKILVMASGHLLNLETFAFTRWADLDSPDMCVNCCGHAIYVYPDSRPFANHHGSLRSNIIFRGG